MRLHRLEVTAFGPFAETVHVDFDQLSEAGLFLLSGPTGSGKTSVLDAVCFALYGDVPGDRNTAKRLRSDQADPGTAPEVSLEATLSGRRFRIVRSPAWERPKKRGTGLTTEQPSVRIDERVDGAWLTQSTRLDETGHLVTRLVGMNVAQFTQVAMLPQGRFQAFLRARSDERHKLLQQLFRTGRFDEVERWLRDRRLELRRSAEVAHRVLADLVSRVSETVDSPLPDTWDVQDLAVPAADGSLLGWVAGLVERSCREEVEGAAAALDATRAEAESRHAVEETRALVARRTRVDAALVEHRELVDQAAQVGADKAALDAARRAATVVPVHRLATQATRTREQSVDTAVAACTHAAETLDLLFVDRPSLETAVEEAAESAARVTAALPREAALAEVRHAVHADERRAVDLRERIEGAVRATETLPARIDTLRGEVDEARAAVTAAEALQGLVTDLTTRSAAHALVRRLREELTVARIDLDAAHATALLRWEELLDLREARLEGMAAEIAGALVVGDSCPVCGSAEHPHRASSAPGAPDAAAEKAALRVLDDAKSTEHARDQRVRELLTRIAVAEQTAGPESPAVVTDRLDATNDELTRVRQVASAAITRSRELAEAETRLHRLTRELAELRVEASALESGLAHRRDQALALHEEVASLLRGTDATELSTLQDQLKGRASAGRAACDALDRLRSAERAEADALDGLADALAAADFSSAAEAVAADLPGAEVTALDSRVAAHERRLAAVTAVLGEPGTDEIAALPVPDLEHLVATHREALDRLGRSQAVSARARRRVERLERLSADLAEAVAVWSPLRADLDLTTSLSAFADGKSADNRLQMRLSAYVLAFRLSQVVAAANARLAGMSDQRYSLEHTGRRGAGETRGGLSILVRDDWSGETRDPATLSGGETFVVSLALALGLADVVTQEAGGAELDTLFVDEGFGSLDADTLDDVMDTLDSLRDGGRVVGVVSHVAEMRDRIPTQLRVTKSRSGSTVEISR